MTSECILQLDDPQAAPGIVGGKGASLARMVRAGLPVPSGFHVTTKAYHMFIQENSLQAPLRAALQKADLNKPGDLERASRTIQELFLEAPIPSELAAELVGAYSNLEGVQPAVAVRSSATAEDLPEASFAGQQESYLNVCGADQVLQAVKKCWASLWTARGIGYRHRKGISEEDIALAIVIQNMVPAEAAGILFTVHPMQGREDQMLISSAWGLGDAIVGGRVSTDDFIVDKASARVVEQKIADKTHRTVQVDGGTQDQEVPDNLRKVPSLDADSLMELSQLGDQIEALYQQPMDIEWALADGDFYILQARPITTLPAKKQDAAEEWILPDPKKRFLRTSVIDFMPNPISPLFASLAFPIYNRSLGMVMADMTNAKPEDFPTELLVTINSYAYYCASFSAREWWGMLSKLGVQMPKLIRNGVTHFRETAYPAHRQTVEELASIPLNSLSRRDMWEQARELLQKTFTYLIVLQIDTLGAAAGSEGLFTTLYEKYMRMEGDPPASIFVMGFDSAPIRSEKSLFDLAQAAQSDPELVDAILNKDVLEICDPFEDGVAKTGEVSPAWQSWCQQFQLHLETYGHILYDLDFSHPLPIDDPTPMIEVIKMFLRGEGSNPHERQREAAQRRETASKELMQRARGLRGWILRKALGWAQTLASAREDSIASIGLAYPRIRSLFDMIGEDLAQSGMIDESQDLYWLEAAEVEAALTRMETSEAQVPMCDVINNRKATARERARLVPPSQLPYSDTYMGFKLESFIPGEGGPQGDRLKGVAASSGCVTGTACVLHGPEDFERMLPGGILVAKITTPAWTPLFAMAAGVVTDIGGPLSHGSIVAREYGIPAVLGTGSASRLIQHGQQITVNGDEGYIILPSRE